jgi:hypothetical protein
MGGAQHPACTPNLSSFKFHILGSLKGATSGCPCMLGSDVQEAVVQWFRPEPKKFFADRTQQLAHQRVCVCVCVYVCGDFFSNCCNTSNREHPRMGFPYIGCFFSYLTDKCRPNALESFITLSKSYYHCNHLLSSHPWLLNLPDTRRMTQRWQSVRQCVGSALIGQAEGEKKMPYTCLTLTFSLYVSLLWWEHARVQLA